MIDNQFKELYKKPFEDSFTKGILGAGNRSPIDEERLGGLIANSSCKAETAARTADALFNKTMGDGVGSFSGVNYPKESMSSAADYLLNKSTAADGGMSLAKMRTNLKKATGVDELFDVADNSLAINLGEDLPSGSAMGQMKDDIIRLIEISGKNKKIQNQSGTAYMNELIRMKNDPWSALVGFVSDTAMATTYKRELFQKWLKNGLISKPQYQKLINAASQAGVQSAVAEDSRSRIGL
jgi:hypothetical protein